MLFNIVKIHKKDDKWWETLIVKEI